MLWMGLSGLEINTNGLVGMQWAFLARGILVSK